MIFPFFGNSLLAGLFGFKIFLSCHAGFLGFFEVCLYLFVHLISILMSSVSEIGVLWS